MTSERIPQSAGLSAAAATAAVDMPASAGLSAGSSLEAAVPRRSRYMQAATRISHPALPIDFLITDCPAPAALSAYADQLDGADCADVVRLCEPTAYDAGALGARGCTVHDEMAFEDGGVPLPFQVTAWRQLCQQVAARSGDAASEQDELAGMTTIAVHCYSGIGRAPLMVAVALIDAGVAVDEAVDYIRKARRGAINRKQLAWLFEPKRWTKETKETKEAARRAAQSGLPSAPVSSKRSSAAEPSNPDPQAAKKSGLFGRLFGKRGSKETS